MALWQIALLALIAAWVIQSAGVWLQMRHYRRTFEALRSQWSDGTLGAGAAPGRLGKGVIALIVVDPKKIVRKTCVMQGRSVFTKFKDRPEFNGIAIDEFKSIVAAPGFERGVGVAISKAIEQIEKVSTSGESRRVAAA
jgi:glucitol operon activator protein